jgi:hypothetical protein
MILKRFLYAFAMGSIFLGNAPREDVPAALASFVVEGELKTDDFGWMRGAFDGATDQQKSDWATIGSWLKECQATAKLKAVNELKALGVMKTSLEEVPIGPPICGSVATFNAMAEPTRNWDEFRDKEARARQVFSIYEFGAIAAQEKMVYEPNWGTEEAQNILKATVMEQVYRNGLGWTSRGKNPKIEANLEPYLNAHLGNAMMKADMKNTDMLKEMVANKGWPSIPIVGEFASSRAWLLVQHADHDPAFQLKALRLMQPLAVKGEVSKADYAYLYDRIMLKLNGKQRFGTQFGGCEGAEYKARPLENKKQLDASRAEYGLEPMREYRQQMKDNFGPCVQ